MFAAAFLDQQTYGPRQGHTKDPGRYRHIPGKSTTRFVTAKRELLVFAGPQGHVVRFEDSSPDEEGLPGHSVPLRSWPLTKVDDDFWQSVADKYVREVIGLPDPFIESEGGPLMRRRRTLWTD